MITLVSQIRNDSSLLWPLRMRNGSAQRVRPVLFLGLLCVAASAVAQQPPVAPSPDFNVRTDKEPVIVADHRPDGTTAIVAAWMSLSEDESYVRVASSTNPGHWIDSTPAKLLTSIPISCPPPGCEYEMSADPFLAINTMTNPHEIYLATSVCERLATDSTDPQYGLRCNGLSAIVVWKSTDGGGSWIVDKVFPGNEARADKPSIAVSSKGDIYLAFLVGGEIHVHVRPGIGNACMIANQGTNAGWQLQSTSAVTEVKLTSPSDPQIYNPQSPIIEVDPSDCKRVYVAGMDHEASSQRIFVAWSEDGGKTFRRTSTPAGRLVTSSFPGPPESGELEKISQLMAHHNPVAPSIGIVWHARETDNDSARTDVKFLSFNTASHGFEPRRTVTTPSMGTNVDGPTYGDQFTPGIGPTPDGRYLVTYYDSADRLRYHVKATLLSASGARLREDIQLTPQQSDPSNYHALGRYLGMGEYQDVFYSGDRWYATFIQVLGGNGDAYVSEILDECKTTLTTTSPLTVPASGGNVHFDVAMTREYCKSWTPSSNSFWAVIDNTAPRAVSGGFNVAVQANTGNQRQATITVDGNSVVITQQAQGCATLPRRVAMAPALASRTDRPIATTVGGGSEGPLFYDWYERLPGETTPRLYYKHTSSIYVTPSQPLTYYSAVVRNSCGQSVSLAEVPIYLCVPTIDAQPVAEQFVPRGGSASLTIAASPAIAGQPVTITWWSYDTGQIVGNGPTLNVTPAPGAMQTYLAHVGTDCSGLPFSMQSQTATVRGCELAASAYGDRTITLGQGAPLSSSISGTQVLPSDAEYTWYSGPAPGTEYASGVGLWTITPTPMSTTTYWVRVKDGTCTADSNTVTVRISAPRDAQVLSQNVPTTMNARRSYTVSTTLKNVGTQSWSPVGPSPQCNVFRLGSTNPQDNVTWGRLRADLPAAVAPDGQVTVTFPVTAPDAPGTYNFQWKMLQECVTWFGDSTPNVAVNVQSAPARDAQVLSQSVPTTMTAGHVYPVSVTLKNVGTETWSPIGASPQCNVYRLGSANPQDNLIWGRMRADLPTAVAPSGLVTINFNVTAPSTSGTYNFQWRMLQECVTWFGDSTPNVGVTVNP